LLKKPFAQSLNKAQINFKGKVYHKVNEITELKNYRKMEGALIPPIGSDYGLSSITNGSNVIILFNKIIHINNGNVNYKIVDAINIGKLNHQVIMMTGCLINKKADPELIGIAKYAEKEMYTNLSKAWRANRKTNKIEEISVKGLSCVDNGYSDDL
jgi:hypothetical protein